MLATEEVKDEQQKVVPDSTDGEGNQRSTISFPYLDLDDSVEISKSVHEVGGTSCQWDQLAARIGAAANGGGFRQRVLTAKLFGLLDYNRGVVTLSQLGNRICDPQQEKSARVDAFLTIPLYKQIYDKFKGASLPPTSGLEGAIVALGVAPKQKGKARQVFYRSAKQADFFTYGADRLVIPPNINASLTTETQEERKQQPATTEEKKKERREAPEKEHHPLIEGLIKTLPQAETQWDLQGRRKWLLAASNIFDLIYTDSDESKGSLRIEVEKSSAK